MYLMQNQYEKPIGSILKECRLRNNLSVDDVVCKLLESYHIRISPKAIYGWEEGLSLPTPTTFLAVCEIYGIHHMECFTHTAPHHSSANTQEHDQLHPSSGRLHLSKEETKFLLLCRKYPQLKEAVMKQLGLE